VPTFFERSDVASASQIKLAYFVKTIELLEICDSACNEPSLIPSYYDRDIAEHQGATPPLIWNSTVSKKCDITPEISGNHYSPAFRLSTQIKKQCESTIFIFCLSAYDFYNLRATEHIGNVWEAQ